ncbi:MAG: endonuclease NucS domain-containing protein [Thermoproteota archaeon]
MIGNYFLQAEGIAIFVVIIIVVMFVIFLAAQRRSISKMKQELEKTSSEISNMKTAMPHYNEVNYLHDNVKKLCDDFVVFRTNIEEQMNKFSATATEDLNKTKELMVRTAKEEVVKAANDHLSQNSVSKEEFEKLRERIEGMIGADEVAERMEILASIFDTSKIGTLNWQCKLIKMLDGGLAPEAEQNHLLSAGVPLTSLKKFLDRLMETGLIEERLISGYYLAPEFEWIYSYVEKPDWLKNRLESRIKKEREYHEYIKCNLHLIEEGLMLEQDEYELATGNIDFICRSATGQVIGLELKYPAATTAVKRQIQGYKNDYEQKTGRNNSRFIVVAPKIPEHLKVLLVQDGLEYKEVNF